MTSIDYDRKVEWPGKDELVTMGEAFQALRKLWGTSVEIAVRCIVGRDGTHTIIEAWPIYPTR